MKNDLPLSILAKNAKKTSVEEAWREYDGNRFEWMTNLDLIFLSEYL
jgi:hypothetical protein